MKPIYDSPFHHPLMAWVFAAITLAFVLARPKGPSLVAFALIFTAEIALDAWLTGAWSPLSESSAWATPLAIAFVITGDLRYFLLVFRVSRPERGALATLAVSLASALVVPLTTTLLSKVFPSTVSGRVLFLIYELLLFAIALGMRLVVLPKMLQGATRDVRRGLFAVALYEIAQYAAWALADVLILSGQDIGYLARIAPNLAYYGGFVLFAYAALPALEAPKDAALSGATEGAS